MPHVWIGSELVFVINSISTGEAKLKVFFANLTLVSLSQ